MNMVYSNSLSLQRRLPFLLSSRNVEHVASFDDISCKIQDVCFEEAEILVH